MQKYSIFFTCKKYVVRGGVFEVGGQWWLVVCRARREHWVVIIKNVIVCHAVVVAITFVLFGRGLFT